MRAVLLDQVGFQHQRFDLVLGRNELQFQRFAGKAPALAAGFEVLTDPAPQVVGLADINRRVALASEYIHSGCGRQHRQIVKMHCLSLGPRLPPNSAAHTTQQLINPGPQHQGQCISEERRRTPPSPSTLRGMTTAALARRDVPRDQTWDIEALYPASEAWDAEAVKLAEDLPQLGSFAGTLGHSPEALAAYLTAREALRLRLTRLMSYASMSASVDGKDTQAAGRRDRASSLGSVFAAATAFENPELLSLDEDRVRPWLSRPDLQDFAVMLERVWRGRPHVRSAEVEELLGLVQAPFASERGIHPALVNMDLEFGTAGGIKIGQGNIDRLLADPDRAVAP